MKFRGSTVDIRVDHAHSVDIKLRDLLIKEEPKSVIQRPCDRQVLERFDILINQVTVLGVDFLHLHRRIRHRHNNHDCQREQSQEYLGPDFEIC